MSLSQARPAARLGADQGGRLVLHGSSGAIFAHQNPMKHRNSVLIPDQVRETADIQREPDEQAGSDPHVVGGPVRCQTTRQVIIQAQRLDQ